MRLSLIADYLRYLFCAKNAHGLHSPFVFELYTKAISTDVELFPPNVEAIEARRKHLLKDYSSLDVNDLGAGSKVSSNISRTVSDIAKVSLKSKKEALLLYRLANFLNCKEVIELGTSLGLTTMYVASVATVNEVVTIEGSEAIALKAKEGFRELNFAKIKLMLGSFNDHLQTTLEQMSHVDMIYIDGDHRLKPTLRYLEIAMKYAHDDTIFVFDDIRWSKEMDQAWKKIIAHPDLHVTIDLFNMGVAFKRSIQEKEHFVLKF